MLLPSCVDASVREAHSKKWWGTEKIARRDVAFEAYIALYKAGLVNDNLLPSDIAEPEEQSEITKIEKRPNLAVVDQQMNMWPSIARQWQTAAELHQTMIMIDYTGQTRHELNMLLPLAIPEVETFRLYWDSDIPYEITLARSTEISSTSSMTVARQITHLLLNAVFRARMSNQEDFIALLVPAASSHDNVRDLESWLDRNSGSAKNLVTGLTQGLIREKSGYGATYILRDQKLMTYEDALILKSSVAELELAPNAMVKLAEVRKFPKKHDLLHDTPNLDKSKQGPGVRYLLTDLCEMDNLPGTMAMAAAFVPSILHVINRTMLVNLIILLLSPLPSLSKYGLSTRG